jgi:hypothetical protein
MTFPDPAITTRREPLKSRNAWAARKEISARWPRHLVGLVGYSLEGETVFRSLVREQGNTAPVPTAKRKGTRPIRFVAFVPNNASYD